LFAGSVTGMDTDGVLSVTLPADAVNSNSGQRNAASDPYSVTRDTVAPTATISFYMANAAHYDTSGTPVYTNETEINVHVEWSEPVADFDAVSGTSASVTVAVVHADTCVLGAAPPPHAGQCCVR
jgi:hypothetical protein